MSYLAVVVVTLVSIRLFHRSSKQWAKRLREVEVRVRCLEVAAKRARWDLRGIREELTGSDSPEVEPGDGVRGGTGGERI